MNARQRLIEPGGLSGCHVHGQKHRWSVQGRPLSGATWYECSKCGATKPRERGAIPLMRIPAGWTYLGLYGSRSGRAKPHYRTAPADIRPGTYRDLLEAWDEAERRRFRGEGREPFRVEWV